MGAEYEAFSIIGCRVDGEKLFTETTVKTCTHTFDASFAFCPKCGKPATETELEALFDEDEGDYNGRLGGLDVVVPFSDDEIPDWAYIGPIVARGSSDGPDDRTQLPADLAAIKEQTRVALDPLGLWDESAFGLWTLLDCSY